MKSLLKDNYEIADYIQENSTHDVDYELIVENYQGYEAILIEIDLKDLKVPKSDNHQKDAKKQKKYNSLNQDNSPPIVIDEKNEIIDGNHRYRAAKHNKLISIKAYKIREISS